MVTYFKNSIVELHVIYVLNMNVKFYADQIFLLYNLYTYFLCIILDYKNLKFKHLIDDIAIKL